MQIQQEILEVRKNIRGSFQLQCPELASVAEILHSPALLAWKGRTGSDAEQVTGTPQSPLADVINQDGRAWAEKYV